MPNKQKTSRFISLKANTDELMMLDFIMDKDARHSVSDCVRMLIKDRFFFLRSHITNAINNQPENTTYPTGHNR